MDKGYKIIKLKAFGDSNGMLLPLEALKNVPFEIKRTYFIYATKQNAIRGRHSHRDLKQIIIAISGSCDFILDNGKTRQTIILNKSTTALYIYGNIWREFANFSKDCVLAVLASWHYNEKDYIRNYDEFLKSVRNAE